MDAPWISLRVVDYVLAAAVLGLLAGSALIGRRRLWRALVHFFTEPGEALDLAVFRIAICVAFWLELPSLRGLQGFTSLPKELKFAPDGLGWLVPHLPLSSTDVTYAWRALQAAIVLTALGVFTRWAAATMALLGAYVFLVPNLFGYVNHSSQHLVWFAVLLAASPSGDSLSIDALRGAWSAPGRAIGKRARAVRYALPLRFAWLMIGLIYLFPGIHKYASAGLRWASGTSLRHRVYWTSFQDGGWPIANGLDRHPLLLTLGGLMTLAFELSFLILILFRRTRPVAAVAGIVFHNMTRRLLHIGFTSLQLAYVSFVPWQRLCAWLGRRLVACRLQLRYDPADAAAARLAALAAVVDVLRTVEIVADATAALTVDAGEQRWTGPDATRRLARRLPMLAPLVPVLNLRGVTAHNPGHAASASARRRARRLSGVMPIAVVASCLTGGVFAAGVAGARDAWPFAMYPTFAGYVPATVPTLGATALRCDHSTIALDPEKAADRVMPEFRYAGLVKHLIGPMTARERRASLSAFSKSILDSAALARSGVAAVDFTRDEVRLSPPPMSTVPLSRTKLLTTSIRRCPRNA